VKIHTERSSEAKTHVSQGFMLLLLLLLLKLAVKKYKLLGIAVIDSEKCK